MVKHRPLPPIEVVQAELDYNPDTGEFIRKKTGARAGSTRHKYVTISLNNRREYAHRLAWLLYYEEDPGELTIDHINQNKRDNRISNLRLATHTEQKMNAPLREDNSTGIKGLSWRPKRNAWRGMIEVNGDAYEIQSKDKQKVIDWLKKKRDELHGEFANH